MLIMRALIWEHVFPLFYFKLIEDTATSKIPSYMFTNC